MVGFRKLAAQKSQVGDTSLLRDASCARFAEEVANWERTPSALEECQKIGVEPVRVREHEAVRRARIHLELTSRYKPHGSSAAQLNRRALVCITVNDQSRRGKCPHVRSKVGLGLRLDHVDGGFQRSSKGEPYPAIGPAPVKRKNSIPRRRTPVRWLRESADDLCSAPPRCARIRSCLCHQGCRPSSRGRVSSRLRAQLEKCGRCRGATDSEQFHPRPWSGRLG